MKKVILTLTLFIIPFFNVFATERTLSLSLTSNYVFRGVTQTDDNAAVQVDYQLSQSEDSGFYAGFFASNVAQGAEVDIFGGFKLAFGNQNKFIIDLGAVEYLYTDDNFAPISHEFYAGVEYEMSYLKYYFGENETRYLDIGTGFVVLGGIQLLLHYGEVFVETAPGGNDFSVSLQKDFGRTKLGLTATYEDKTVAKESELFAFISVAF
ncbi:MAG: TorF family putative porin [Gammaproteobacteria bacterium]|nr:TorF family putative porin [Gammaproteobacteria bacterium]